MHSSDGTRGARSTEDMYNHMYSIHILYTYMGSGGMYAEYKKVESYILSTSSDQRHIHKPTYVVPRRSLLLLLRPSLRCLIIWRTRDNNVTGVARRSLHVVVVAAQLCSVLPRRGSVGGQTVDAIGYAGVTPGRHFLRTFQCLLVVGRVGTPEIEG